MLTGERTCNERVPGAAAGREARGLEQQRGELAQLEHHARADLRLREHLRARTGPAEWLLESGFILYSPSHPL